MTDDLEKALEALRGIDRAMRKARDEAIKNLPDDQRKALAEYQLVVLKGSQDDL